MRNFSGVGCARSIVCVWAVRAACGGFATYGMQEPRRKLIETADIVDVAVHTQIGSWFDHHVAATGCTWIGHGLATTSL